MFIEITGKNFNPSDKLEATIEKKFAKLDKYFSSEARAAIMVRNSETEQKLVPTLQQLLGDHAKQEEMKANIGKFARPNAADDIVEIVLKEARSKK